MLVLTRRPGESLLIGDDVRITLVSSASGHARIAIEAPEDVAVYREEVHQRVAKANRAAAAEDAAAIEAISSRAVAPATTEVA